MTWILGLRSSGGYVALLADIRVTLADGTERDLLQKLYPVGGNHAVAFAGSVAIGLRTIETIKRRIRRPKRSKELLESHAWLDLITSVASKCWAEGTKEQRKLRLQLLVGTVVGSEYSSPGLYKFESPAFHPDCVANDTIVSLGSGSVIQDHQQLIQDIDSDLPTLPYEYHAATLVNRLVLALQSTPQPGVSHHLHVAYIERGQITFGPHNGVVIRDGHPEHELIMPRVSASSRSFERAVGQHPSVRAVAS
jgi:hypothetical protein